MTEHQRGTPAPGDGSVSVDEGIERLIRDADLRTEFSPIVDLERGRIASYKANVVGGAPPYDDPRTLRESLRASAMNGEFDAAARLYAIKDAHTVGLLPEHRIVIDAEFESLAVLEPAARLRDRSVILQLQTRVIKKRPGQVLRALHEARSLGYGIAIRDVGGDLADSAYLPLINPAMIVHDRAVLTRWSPERAAALIAILGPHCDRTGAVVLAEGIASTEDLRRAKALGARLGRGPHFDDKYRYVRPPEHDLLGEALDGHIARNASVQTGPFAVLSSARTDNPVRRGSADLVGALLREVLASAEGLGSAAVVLVACPDAAALGDATLDRLRALGADGHVVVLLAGAGLPESLGPVRLARIDDSDDLRREVAAVVVSPRGGITLSGEVHGGESEAIDFVLSYEPQEAIDAARSLLSRLPIVR